ncbi:MAG: hypothetical protein IPN19_02345 [Elusimicrobia bacterium]|nr:hypothetical protein [Elusimicrobiota bacterium]
MDQTYELPQDLIKNKEYRVRVEAVGHNMKRVSSAERSGTTNSRQARGCCIGCEWGGAHAEDGVDVDAERE